jgi:hypothetical protein
MVTVLTYLLGMNMYMCMYNSFWYYSAFIKLETYLGLRALTASKTFPDILEILLSSFSVGSHCLVVATDECNNDLRIRRYLCVLLHNVITHKHRVFHALWTNFRARYPRTF